VLFKNYLLIKLKYNLNQSFDRNLCYELSSACQGSNEALACWSILLFIFFLTDFHHYFIFHFSSYLILQNFFLAQRVIYVTGFFNGCFGNLGLNNRRISFLHFFLCILVTLFDAFIERCLDFLHECRIKIWLELLIWAYRFEFGFDLFKDFDSFNQSLTDFFRFIPHGFIQFLCLFLIFLIFFLFNIF
jgi:hypothetical protein